MTESQALDWKLETAWLARQALENKRGKGAKAERAGLAECLRSVIIAHVIVHKEQPSLNDIATTLQTYQGAETLIGQAERSAGSPSQKKAAQRCEAWRKATARGTSLDISYLQNCFTNWVESQEQADEPLNRLEGDERTTAATRLGWNLMDGDEAETGSEPTGGTKNWRRFETALARAAEESTDQLERRILQRVRAAAGTAQPKTAGRG